MAVLRQGAGLKMSFLHCVAAGLLLPWLTVWVRRQERAILRNGRPLTARERAAAAEVGVQRVDALRVAEVAAVPLPGPRWLRQLAVKFGYPSQSAIGMCLRYGIYVDARVRESFPIVVHECVHAAQYERLGIRRFLSLYIKQCLKNGYAAAPLEQEASQWTARLCGQA